jgi:hypothetical protein
MVIVIDGVSSRLGSWCNIPVAVQDRTLGGARVEAIESSLDVLRSGPGS